VDPQGQRGHGGIWNLVIPDKGKAFADPAAEL